MSPAGGKLPRSSLNSNPRHAPELPLTHSATRAAAALAGVRVLDLSRVLAGPLCTMILGDLGASVIKVERPGTGDETRQWGPPWSFGSSGDRQSAYFLSTNRNKRSIVADLNSPEGRELVRRLAVEADVVVENFAPGALHRWELSYEHIVRENPRVVFCSVTGYGSEGRDASLPGYDFTVQARSGWMAVTGEAAGSPMKVGFALVDVLTGQNAALAILAALLERANSGRGQHVEVSLIGSAMAGLVNVAQAALVTGEEPARYGNAHPAIVPYQLFETADRPIVVAVGNDRQWQRLCRVIGVPGAATDPRFSTNPKRVEHRYEVVELLERSLRTRTAEEWRVLMESAGVPCALVQTVREALADPAIEENHGLWEVAGATYGVVRSVAAPFRLERTPAALHRSAPALGEHTAEVERNGWAG